jgi:hypothetical protein
MLSLLDFRRLGMQGWLMIGGAFLLIVIVVLIIILSIGGGNSQATKDLYGTWMDAKGEFIYEFRTDGVVNLSSNLNDTKLTGKFKVKSKNIVIEFALKEKGTNKEKPFNLSCRYSLNGDVLSMTSDTGAITNLYRKDSDTFNKVVAAADAASLAATTTAPTTAETTTTTEVVTTTTTAAPTTAASSS